MQILEDHIDSFGHVNNATYATLFERARWDLISNRGYGIKEIQSQRKGPVILEMKIKFKAEVLLREFVEIRSQAEKSDRTVFKIYQKMMKPDGQLAADAEFTVGFFDLDRRRLTEPTPQWMQAIDTNSIS